MSPVSASNFWNNTQLEKNHFTHFVPFLARSFCATKSCAPASLYKDKGKTNKNKKNPPTKQCGFVTRELTSFQQASSAVQAAVPALIPELIATLQEAEAHRLPQRLGQARFPATQSLLAPAQTHLLALLQVRLARRRLVGKRAW